MMLPTKLHFGESRGLRAKILIPVQRLRFGKDRSLAPQV